MSPPKGRVFFTMSNLVDNETAFRPPYQPPIFPLHSEKHLTTILLPSIYSLFKVSAQLVSYKQTPNS